MRWIAQYDSTRAQWLTDLLASYEFAPGTAVHAGYGAVYERGVDDMGGVHAPASFLNVTRGLFFKASYLHRF